jgi:hypothetical protein
MEMDEMKVNPIEVKSKWTEMGKEMPCKPNKCFLHICSTSLDDCTCPRHKERHLAMINVIMDQKVKLVVPNLQQ